LFGDGPHHSPSRATPGTPQRTAPVENVPGLQSGDRPQRLCTVAQLALDARKDLGIPVGSMPVQL
jgi:hypothetical protein